MTEFSGDTIAKKIERYVIDNPMCIKHDIEVKLGITKNTVSMTLTRLRAIGRIRKVAGTLEKNGRTFRVTRWEAGIEDGIALKDKREGSPKQNTVRTWESNSTCDPLVALFFGRRP